jgi:nucleoside phosphorylase
MNINNKGDIVILSALMAEASPCIKFFSFKPITTWTKFQIFESNFFEDFTLRLIVSGVGKVKAVTALSIAITPSTKLVINIGIAGSTTKELTIGSIWKIIKIVDYATKKCFFPECLNKDNLGFQNILTVDTPMWSPCEGKYLIDMESSGLAQVSSLLSLAPHQLLFLKIVSDYCEKQKFDRDFVSQLISQNLSIIESSIRSYINQIVAISPIAIDVAPYIQLLSTNNTLTQAEKFLFSDLFRGALYSNIPSNELHKICYENKNVAKLKLTQFLV